MSVADFPAPARGEQRGPELDRTPPQDVAAEQSVLGAMLLSKDAIADVVEVLRGNDFYRPAHELVYDAVLDLYGRGEPADAVTVAAELTKRGELARVGGAPYLHTLISTVPTAASAGYYAQIVRERAVLRRLVQAGTRIVQMGYAGEGGEVDDIVDRAQAEVYSVTERRASEDYAPLSAIMEGTLDEIEAIGSRGGQLVGVPTGFVDLDQLTNGLHPGQMIVLAARPAVGKALALDTPLPTPTGWTTMGAIDVGDPLLGADGRATAVRGATEVLHGRPCFALHFSDGTVLVADAAHQWLTETPGVPGSVPAVRTTAALAAAPGGTFAVRSGAPMDLPAADLPVRPYGPGAWLGAGAAGRARVPVSHSAVQLRLAGGDGPPAAGDLAALAVLPDTRLPRLRLVTAVRPVPSVPVRCVEVDAADHLYLAGRTMVPTHNSTLGLDIARSASIRHQLTSVIFSLEMSRNEITMRLLSAEAKVPLHHMRSGTMSEDDWNKLARRMGEVSSAPLFVDDSPNMSMMEIRAKCRRLKQRHDLRLVVVDYLQLMTSGKRVESRQQEVSEFSRALKLLAKELEVPVVAISQLNRGPEQRTDKRPQMADLRESGCLTEDTRVLRADTGAETTLGELYRAGARDVPVWALDDRLRYVRRPLTRVFTTGVKPVHRLRLASGRELRATGNHRFLTYDGWTRLDQVKVGDRLAAPRHIPAAQNLTEWDDRQVILLAHLIGGGSLVRGQPGPEASSHARHLPDPVFALPTRQITMFLRHLWATNGCVCLGRDPGRQIDGRIHYATTSRRLAGDVGRLLWRLGVQACIKRAIKPGERPAYHVHVCAGADQRAFDRVVAGHDARGETAARVAAALEGMDPHVNADTVPQQVWDKVRDILVEQDPAPRPFAAAVATKFRGSTLQKSAPCRDRLSRIAAVLDDASIEMVATNDVAWDRVVGIDPDGEELVYDATVAGAHNFVANGIAAHNSIEQDADMVILLHREELYERESPRAGEADFIVAKHRNGPTATITVAFQGHYSRFVDMAHM